MLDCFDKEDWADVIVVVVLVLCFVVAMFVA